MAPNLAQPIAQYVLSRFGGSYTEADPRDLPMGASPRNHDVDFMIGGVTIRPGLTAAITSYSPFTPTPGSTFLYVKSSFVAAAGTPPLKNPVTLAQSSDGILWQELFASAGTMTAFYSGILNNGRAISENVDDVEFIALSNLIQGVDQPRTWDGQYLDRVSQVGPGAGPLVASGGIGNILIVSISQPSAHNILEISSSVGGLGNVWIGPTLSFAEFPISGRFTIAGVSDSLFNGNNFTVLSYVASGTRYPIVSYFPNPGANLDIFSSGTMQSQLATLTSETPHNLVPGQSFVISDTGTSYDGTWTVFDVSSPTVLTFNASGIFGNYAPSVPVGIIGTMSGQIAAGPRYCICMFVMRNGDITPASPPVPFETAASDSYLSFSNIPIGPPECVGRIIAVTPAYAGIGGPYYYLPNGSGVFNPTVIDDNTTTSLYDPSFSDAVLVAGINCTTVGFNVLQMREIGEFVKPVLYAGRVFAMGERVKVDNLPNLTFDGGTQTPGGSPPTTDICGWTKQSGFESWIGLITSPIYGQSLEITNRGGSTLNATPIPYASLSATLGQFNINTDAFGVATIRPNTPYSVRFTAWGTYGAVTGGASVIPALVNDTTDTIYGPSLPVLTQTPQEFVGTYNLPMASILPTLDLVVIPYNVPPGETVYIDRIEIFPSQDPIYNNQLIGSYIDAFQQFDSQSGPVDTSLYSTDPITNQFKFINTLYITTRGLTLATNDTAGSEPDGWAINEISNAVGCLGPLASDVGEEYVLIADRHGAYVFDGGNHIKFSQEIQQWWEQIYWPTANTSWIKNDLHQQRILIGVPMVLPNKYFPDAPANAAPTTPNIILCCSVLGLASGADIAGSPGVHVSAFTGQLLARDMSRKWTGWYIQTPACEWINRPTGSEQLWIGNVGVGDSAGKPQIYYLNTATFSDDLSGVINQQYATFGFSDEQSTQQFNLGQVIKFYEYMTATIEGSGGMVLTTYPETMDSLYPTVAPPVDLETPQGDDVNLPLNERGNRLFLQFGVDGAVNSHFSLRRVVLGCVSDPKIPVSGV